MNKNKNQPVDGSAVKRRPGILLFLVIALLLLVLSGCGMPASAPTNSGVPAKSGDKVIVTSFYPIYILTLNVCQDIPGVKVVNMTGAQTGCLHDYQLRTGDIKTLEGAAFFVVNGAGMEAFMAKVVKQQPDLKIIEAARGIPLLKGAGNQGDNPHVWVSPTLYIKEIANVSEQLAQADPAHADQYRRNGQAYIEKVSALRAEMHKELDGLPNRNIVTFHEAFPYFAQEFKLNIVAVIEREPGSAPSAAELAQTIELVKKSGTKALFAEPQYPIKAAQSIAGETGARVFSLDPGVTGPDRPDGYLQIMGKNLTTLKEALQ